MTLHALPILAIEEFAERGYVVVEHVLPDRQIEEAIVAVAEVEGRGLLQRNGSSYAIRDLLQSAPAIRGLAHSAEIQSLLRPILGPNAFAVRGILFDKILEANWKVPWHQDMTIEVAERFETPGFGPWSIKHGIHHVQPPVEILENMVSVRIHLDDCTVANGPLRVIPRTHRFQKLSIEEILSWREQYGEQAITIGRGGVLLMSPLLAHASSSAESPDHRRVIHIDYANCSLPGALKWRAIT